MEPAHFEAAMNGDINKFPFCDIQREDLSEIFNKVSPSGNSLLHVASSSGHEDMTQLIARNFPFLIIKKNSDGDTPLHLAVRAQKLETVRTLVNIARQTSTSTDTCLTMKNDEGNTALHEALLAILHASRKNVHISVDVACYLILNDPKVTCHQNNVGKSPLFMAIESGNKEILEYIFSALPEDNGLIQILEGKSPVHVAIEHEQLDMLKIIKEQREELLLLRDEEGNTPLHFAAHRGYVEGVRYLLGSESNWAFKRNNKGFYPLHLACENGHISVTKELFWKWPNPSELVCNQGHTILHIAAKRGKENMVRFILNQKDSDKLVNKIDKNGNTPHHLAALHDHPMVVVALLFDKRSKSDIVNYQGLTAYDILKLHVLTKVQNGQTDSKKVEENSTEVELSSAKKFQMMMVYSILYIYNEIFRRGQFWRRHHYSSTKMSHIKIKKPSTPKKDLNNTISYLFVVAALLVGAAFSGALQIPSDISDDNVGMTVDNNVSYHPPTKGWTKNLNTYLINNSTTMSLSITAAFCLFLTLLVDTNLTNILVYVSFLLLALALTCMGSSFLAAMSLRFYTNRGCPLLIDITTTIVDRVQVVLVVITVVGFVLGQEALAIIIYSFLYCCYSPLHRLWSMIRFNSVKTFTKYVIQVSFVIVLLYIAVTWTLGFVIYVNV